MGYFLASLPQAGGDAGGIASSTRVGRGSSVARAGASPCSAALPCGRSIPNPGTEIVKRRGLLHVNITGRGSTARNSCLLPSPAR